MNTPYQETVPPHKAFENARALATFIDCQPDEFTHEGEGYDGNGERFSLGSQEYLVCTDEEADSAVHNYIRENLWAFRPTFLRQYIGKNGLPMEGEAMLEAFQEKCECANESLLAMVGDRFDELVMDAIGCDGRGPFLSPYDGEEHESGNFYVYRTN